MYPWIPTPGSRRPSARPRETPIRTYTTRKITPTTAAATILWLKITLGVMFGVLAAALILRMTVYKDSLFMNYLTSLLLGLACAVLFYTRRFRNTQKDGKLYNVVSVVLAIMALIYGIMGLAGLLSYFGIL